MTTGPQPTPGEQSSGEQSSGAQQPHGQASPGPVPGQHAAGQPGYAAAPPAPYGYHLPPAQPGAPTTAPNPTPNTAPNHPSATPAMVLGAIGLVGLLACGGATLVLSPFAWVIGGRAVKEIDDAPPGTWGGREQATAGRIMGIIGTVLLVLGVLAIAAAIAIAFAVGAD